MKIINCLSLETSGVESNASSDYPYYRIPGIVAFDNGSMAVCYECRRKSDWSVIDIGFRCSVDAGKTWSDRRIIVSGKGRNTINNPVLFADGDILHLLYCENYKRMFYTKSNDLGNSWDNVREITDVFDAHYWSCIAVGPGHGLVHSDGDLIAPVWLAFNQDDMFSHHPSRCGVIYSNDKGKTWVLSQLFEDVLVDPSEAALAELSDKRVLINIRNENKEHCRAVSVSKKGFAEWSTPALRYDLIDPVCFAGMCNADKDILFVNCKSKESRSNLTLHRSADDGRTWDTILIDPSGGYSDVCFNKKTGTAFVLYETKDCRYMKIAEISLTEQ